MRFIINKTGNSFGDKFISIRDTVNGQLIELDAVEGEHSHLEYQLKHLNVVRLKPSVKDDLLKCMATLYVISCNPVDVKLLKQELKCDHTAGLIRLAKCISSLDHDLQARVLRFI